MSCSRSFQGRIPKVNPLRVTLCGCLPAGLVTAWESLEERCPSRVAQSGSDSAMDILCALSPESFGPRKCLLWVPPPRLQQSQAMPCEIIWSMSRQWPSCERWSPGQWSWQRGTAPIGLGAQCLVFAGGKGSLKPEGLRTYLVICRCHSQCMPSQLPCDLMA